MLQTSTGKKLFQKKPLGRRWHLMSKPARSGICEFSVHYVWNGAKARLRWNSFFPVRTFINLYQPLSKCPQKLFLNTVCFFLNLMIVSISPQCLSTYITTNPSHVFGGIIVSGHICFKIISFSTSFN